jgi:uncharacterized Zn finger protein (UPF0148 family)
MKYRVESIFGGRRTVVFACPKCSAPLESPLEEAGQSFACPTCAQQTVTPGVPELQQWLSEHVETEARQAAAKQNREQEAARRAAAQERERLEVEQRKQLANQRQLRRLSAFEELRREERVYQTLGEWIAVFASNVGAILFYALGVLSIIVGIVNEGRAYEAIAGSSLRRLPTTLPVVSELGGVLMLCLGALFSILSNIIRSRATLRAVRGLTE